jgi:uncharacterized membrane protein YqjE
MSKPPAWPSKPSAWLFTIVFLACLVIWYVEQTSKFLATAGGAALVIVFLAGIMQRHRKGSKQPSK